MSGFHECELKVKIDNELRTELREMVVKKGYVLTDSRIETDYIMDTPETAFGKNLFRVRDMNNAEGKTILYTIKLKTSVILGESQRDSEHKRFLGLADLGYPVFTDLVINVIKHMRNVFVIGIVAQLSRQKSKIFIMN